MGNGNNGMSRNRRDFYLDYWRGLFHLLMLVDHLPFIFPGLFTLIAGWFEFLGYSSVAEGFVFLSGYVTGLVYARVKREKGAVAMWRKALSRAFTIYVSYVLAVVLLIILVKWLGTADVSWGSWKHLIDERLPLAMVEAATLLWQPTFLEILPMYSLFLLFAPAILNQLDQKRYWLVIGPSVLLWTANQFGLRTLLLGAVGIDATHLGYFNFLAWQILFAAGIICGHKTSRVDQPWLPKSAALSVAAYALAVFCFAGRHHMLDVRLGVWWVDRSALGPLRLLDFACLTYLVARFRGLIGKLIAWRGLAFLSQHSLQVFAFHLIPIYAASLFIVGRGDLSWWEQLTFIGFCGLSLFCIAWASRLIKSQFHFPLASLRAVPRAAEEVKIK